MPAPAQMRGHVPQAAAAGPAAPVASEETGPAQEQEDAAAEPDERPLPDHVTDCGDSWLYELQNQLAPTADDPKGRDFEKVRVRKTIYGRDLLAVARLQPDSVFAGNAAMAASLSGLRPAELERLHVQDFDAVLELVGHAGAHSRPRPKSPAADRP